MPSERVIWLTSAALSWTSRKRTTKSEEMRIQMGISLRIVSLRMASGRIKAARPRISKILRMLEPMTLPSTMSVEPAARALMETASSGAEVPKAMMVRPMRVLDTLKLVAVEAAPSTKKSAPLMSKTKPTMSKTICKTISISFIIAQKSPLRGRGAGRENRTLISSLENLHTNHCTIPAGC